MKRIELLSPAGDMASFKSAVCNGCDAIYISGHDYGARKFASNFSLEEIGDAVRYAHLYDVKVYVTVNTLVYESEVFSFLDYLEALQNLEVDAIIVQDIGMIDLIHKKFPNLEIHASTQAHNHNSEGISFLKSLGVHRVVLARELSLSQIKDIDVDIEKEVFIHGALCVSYSGQCLASSVLMNRSGNRGLCAGLCRLPYDLYCGDEKIDISGKYLISPKEFSSIHDLKKLLDLGVDSLKIEGRMKSAAYVGLVTKIYRTLIDQYYHGEELKISDDDFRDLKKLYNRDFTKGFLYDEDNSNLINEVAPNHLGVEVGKVLEIDKRIKIKLSDDLSQFDGIRFSNQRGMTINFLYNEEGLLINSARSGDIVFVDNKVGLKEKGIVLKTTDYLLMKKFEDLPDRKIDISICVEAFLGKPLKIVFSDGVREVVKTGNVVDASINVPTSKEDIVSKLSRLGNTPFSVRSIEVHCDDAIFIPVKELNDLRREMTEELTLCRQKRDVKKVVQEVSFRNSPSYITHDISFVVRTEKQLLYLLNYDVKIYVEDYALFKKYRSSKVFYRLPRVISNFHEFENENLVVSELGAVFKYSHCNTLYSDIYMNVVNSYSLDLLCSYGIKKIGLSVELIDDELKYLLNSFSDRHGFLPNVEMLVYGKLELMLMKYCVLNKFVNKNKICKVCQDSHIYYLKDRNSKMYPLDHKGCVTRLMHYENVNKLDKIDKYLEMGVTNFRIDLFDEGVLEIEKILEKLKK